MTAPDSSITDGAASDGATLSGAEEPDPATRQRLRITAAIVLFVIVVVSAVLVSTVSPPGVLSHVVGQYSGKPIDEVRAATEANAWVLDEDQVRSNTFEQGAVISQSPTPGTLLEEGELLTVDVASGPLLVQLPQVVGLAVNDAVELLEANGFVVGLIVPRFEQNIPAEQVVELTLNDEAVVDGSGAESGTESSTESGTEPTAEYEPGTVVTLTVSAVG